MSETIVSNWFLLSKFEVDGRQKNAMIATMHMQISSSKEVNPFRGGVINFFFHDGLEVYDINNCLTDNKSVYAFFLSDGLRNKYAG